MPFSPEQYQLLDFGQGRKLERFDEYVLDRPAPAAMDLATANPVIWDRAHSRYDRTEGDRGVWSRAENLPQHWTIDCDGFRLELKPTEFGHLGIFPEQAEHWAWIVERVRAAERPLKVLNLFAYTGGSTLAAAAAGAEVVHVDAVRSTVGWARQNAAVSGLAGAPIRWIVEDAPTFVRRELKRGNRYDAVILDPPSYGHGGTSSVWRFERDLPQLLAGCAELTAGKLRFMLLTGHTPGFGPQELAGLLSVALGRVHVACGDMSLVSEDGRRLNSGTWTRWQQ
jgi:23S rRNA (cytosine1962-C5)-methyltransferase